MNPAALRVNLRDLKPAGLLVVNTGAFNPGNLKKAGYDKNPLDDGSLDAFRVLNRHLPPHHAGRRVLRPRQQEALRAKNMWTLGLMMWMFGRKRESTLVWLRQKIPTQPRRVNPQFVTAGAATGPHEAELEVGRDARDAAEAPEYGTPVGADHLLHHQKS